MSNWNQLQGYLCVGGPLHGQMNVVNSGDTCFQVQIAPAAKPLRVTPPPGAPEKLNDVYRVGVYCLQDIADQTCWVFQL